MASAAPYARRLEDDDAERRWEAAGLWDVRQSLMPMAAHHLTPEQRAAYLRGYRIGGFATGINNHRDEKRPGPRQRED